jgi:hypothetical protein
VLTFASRVIGGGLLRLAYKHHTSVPVTRAAGIPALLVTPAAGVLALPVVAGVPALPVVAGVRRRPAQRPQRRRPSRHGVNVGPLLQGRQRTRRDRIGRSRARLIEEDESAERCHRFDPSLNGRQLRKGFLPPVINLAAPDGGRRAQAKQIQITAFARIQRATPGSTRNRPKKVLGLSDIVSRRVVVGAIGAGAVTSTLLCATAGTAAADPLPPFRPFCAPIPSPSTQNAKRSVNVKQSASMLASS